MLIKSNRPADSNPPMKDSRGKIWPDLVLLFISSLAIKAAIIYFVAEPVLFNKYPYFAERISGGIDIGERLLDLSPFYLQSAVLFFKIFGHRWDVLVILQILLGSLNCLLVYAIGSRIFSRAAGFIAAVLLALYGNMTLIELTLEPEILLLIFNSLAVLALLAAGKEGEPSPRFWKWFLAGALIGLSAISKANALLIIPGALVWILLSVTTWKGRCLAMILLLFGTAVVISPITVRNYLRFGDFVLITADGGKVFFHGNGPGATGMKRADLPDQGVIEAEQGEPDYAHALFRERARIISKAPLSPSECSRFWFTKTLKYMLQHPGVALGLVWKKICLFWNNYEVHDTDTTYNNYRLLRQTPLLNFGIVAVLGLLGMGVAFGRFRKTFLIYWMVLIYFISSIVFFPASRYRLPAVPFLSLFAADFIVYAAFLIRRKKVPILIMIAALIPGLLAWSYLPYRQEIGEFDRWQRETRTYYSLSPVTVRNYLRFERGKKSFDRGNYQKAVAQFQTVVSAAPRYMPAYNYMGKAYVLLGNIDKARECFQQVILLCPEIDEGFLNMGYLLEQRGDIPAAVGYFEKALSVNPNNPNTEKHLSELKKALGQDLNFRE